MATPIESSFATAIDFDDLREWIGDWKVGGFAGVPEGPSLPELLTLLVDIADQQQRTIDALASTLHTRVDNLHARLYGDGSRVPSQGDIPVMRRDVLALMRAEVERVVGSGRIHCHTDEPIQPHRRTTDEAATYSVATS